MPTQQYKHHYYYIPLSLWIVKNKLKTIHVSNIHIHYVKSTCASCLTIWMKSHIKVLLLWTYSTKLQNVSSLRKIMWNNLYITWQLIIQLKNFNLSNIFHHYLATDLYPITTCLEGENMDIHKVLPFLKTFKFMPKIILTNIQCFRNIQCNSDTYIIRGFKTLLQVVAWIGCSQQD